MLLLRALTSRNEDSSHNQEHNFDPYSRVNLDLCTYIQGYQYFNVVRLNCLYLPESPASFSIKKEHTYTLSFHHLKVPKVPLLSNLSFQYPENPMPRTHNYTLSFDYLGNPNSHH